MDLGFAGLEWDTEKTKALFAGRLTLPEVDPLQLAAASYGLKVTEDDFDNNYDEAEATSASGGTHVYVASRRFVHWGGPETAARLIAVTIFDGGNQATQEAQQELTLEVDRLYAWVALNLQSDATKTLSELFTSALSAVKGGEAQLPYFSLVFCKVRLTPVELQHVHRVAPIW